ncbi:hypothetical protein HYX18_01660 [Candidatus Woesearchaeota archaeon]|nr:hypothetical protein [Candidatus Woesearchaeota archaeon]
MEPNIWKQKANEGCLAVCLLSLLEFKKGIKIDKDEEYSILFEGMRFGPLDFSTGHLLYLARKFPDIVFEQHIEFKAFREKLEKLIMPNNLKLVPNKIYLRFLKKYLNDGPVIIYMDRYDVADHHDITEMYHSPHFVILLNLNDETGTVLDPLTGTKIAIKVSKLMKSINFLRKKFWISPKLIKVV